jgi:hypothetical protein
MAKSPLPLFFGLSNAVGAIAAAMLIESPT